MTEQEWLNGCNYRLMFDVIRERLSTRQARLFMVSCCRMKSTDFFDARIHSALATVELCANDPAIESRSESY